MKYVLLVLLCVVSSALAQEPLLPPDTADTARPAPALDTLSSDTLHIDTAGSPRQGSDTILFVPPAAKNEVPVTDTINLERRLRQNPTKALFKSLIIPGWGQVGNGRYLKAAVVVGLDTWFVGAAIHYDRRASELKKKYEAATTRDSRNMYYGAYEDRRQERTKYLFFLGVTTLVSIFDAYVDAHLSGSPIARDEKEISFQVGPELGSGLRAQLSYRF